ncbi:MAG: isocitrate dehydrogenase [Pseudopedobacter saltans]|uniref:Isocitrate dehydrogenase [NADP] n=1 Tax=Pseudopedobacter saltans TaxID=151895 RepID=A0A2W5EME0_9SPHI|nr:MAG: isocitrate dehydrogenase [Pseudopedobacter saltans]
MKIAVAKGDGIGPEIMDAVIGIFNAANVPLEYEYVDMGKWVFEKGFNNGMTPDAKETIEDLGILCKGPMETPKGKGVKSINVTARKTWNTYANRRTFQTLHGVNTVFSKAGIPIDITIVRENIEDTYGGIEHMLSQDVAVSRRMVTGSGSEQVIRYTFEMAQKQKATRVTCGHKANIMKLTDGLFLKKFYEIAQEYPDLNADDVIVDDLCMKLVTRPNLFDVVVLTNLQGDIVSDLCAGLVGGLGFAPSANIGDHVCIFEAVHGTAPDIAGKGIANPTALLLSGIAMLNHLGLTNTAAKVENALLFTLESGAHTGDFGDKSTPVLNTKDFADTIIANFGKEPSHSVRVGAPDEPIELERPHLTENIMMLPKTKEPETIVGLDFFVKSSEQPNVLAEKAKTISDDKIKLINLSNRGTQVWPTGSVFTNLTNIYGVRFESEVALTQNEINTLCEKTAKILKVVSVESLLKIGENRSYSLAQGQ